MRILLVGSASARARLRRLLDEGAEVVGEALTVAHARRADVAADAWVMAPEGLDDEEPAAESLTPRELEVLALIAEGLSNKAIAGRLGISDQTVKFHVAAIAGKLGAANRTDIVRRAVRRGYVAL
jgi:DNA-binding NarL/FixJ family response regulator